MNSIFPKFQKLTEEFYGEYQKFLYDFPQHCDYALANLLIWLEGGNGVFVSRLNGNLVLRFSDSLYINLQDQVWYTILGNQDADETLSEVFRQLGDVQIKAVPDYFVNAIQDRATFEIVEDDDNKDYILEIDQLLNKNGKLYENFRYAIGYFLKNYSEHARIKELDLLDTNDVTLLINSMHQWPKINSFMEDGNDPTRVDGVAIEKLINIEASLPVKHTCYALYIEDMIQGFTIFHIPHSRDKIALGNHIKFNGDFKRTFDFLVYATASKLKEHGVKLINAEQDMGLVGIRHHKSALNPITYYRRYSVSLSATLETKLRHTSFSQVR